tara:strand:- start:1080 stop:1265 length:186 start_codon:yes stop_codon:yes gene_type:complete
MSCIQNELRLENLYEEELEKALEEYKDIDKAELVAEERALKRYNDEEDGYHTMMAEVTATE